MEKEGNGKLKERILILLNTKLEKLSTSEIAGRLSRGYYDILNTLEELEKENKVEKTSFKNSTYWGIKNE